MHACILYACILLPHIGIPNAIPDHPGKAMQLRLATWHDAACTWMWRQGTNRGVELYTGHAWVLNGIQSIWYIFVLKTNLKKNNITHIYIIEEHDLYVGPHSMSICSLFFPLEPPCKQMHLQKAIIYDRWISATAHVGIAGLFASVEVLRQIRPWGIKCRIKNQSMFTSRTDGSA